jgi:bile acid:Na+ symporter, BASS family
MPLEGWVPQWLFTTVAAATVFVIMFDLGLALVPREFRWVVEHPALMAKAIFAVLVAVPALAWLVCRALDLPRAAEVGIMLMSIAPGAPVALRRSIGAGGHRSFAPALQIAVVVLGVVTMPLYLAVLDEYYAATATIDARHLARQVLVAQLLPLVAGMTVTRFLPRASAWLEPRLARVGGMMLLALLALALVDIWRPVITAGPRAALAIALVTALAVAAGHALGGPAPATRTATAISAAARNPGLALLVATLNNAPPGVIATVLAYLVVAAVTLIPYVAWRKRAGKVEAVSPP